MTRTALVLVIGLSACAGPRFASIGKVGDLNVATVELGYSSVHLLRAGSAVALIDAGSPTDWDDFVEALAAEGLKPSDIKVVLLTHAHGDHAGMAAQLQAAGAKIVLGKGDEGMAREGKNAPVPPTSVFARLLWLFVNFAYPPFTADVLLDGELDLAPYGLPGVRARHMSGHTPGSMVVLTDDAAFVGDMMLGGWFGGALFAKDAGEHYYETDFEQNHCNVESLLTHGVERFFLGHGGPVSRESVLAWRADWDEPPQCKTGGP